MRGLTMSEKEELDTYTAFFHNLFEETQMSDIREIVACFDRVVGDKDRLHREIVSTNREIELLEEEIAREKKKMGAFKQLTPEEMQKLNEVRALEAEKQRNQELLTSYSNKIGQIERSILAFRDGLPPVLDALDIDVGNRKLDATGQLNINKENIGYLLELLAKVEDKVNSLVQMNKHISGANIPLRKTRAHDSTDHTKDRVLTLDQIKDEQKHFIDNLKQTADRMKIGQDNAKKDELITADLKKLRQDARNVVDQEYPRLSVQTGRQLTTNRGEVLK